MLSKALYAATTQKVVALLEAGAPPWQSPFSNSVPANAVSGRKYNGSNILLLWLAAMERGWKNPAYLTFLQAKQVGATIRKGEKAHPVIFVSFTKDDETDREVPFAKISYVFNVEQVENLPEQYNPAPKVWDKDEQYAAAYDFFNDVPAEVRYGADKAYYVPSKDYVAMPHATAFSSADAFFRTLSHELCHWSGHKDRCNRVYGKRFADPEYSHEELIAEMGAAFLMAQFGYTGHTNSAAYLAGWLKLLKQDPRALFSIASYAGHAADYIGKAVEASRTAKAVMAMEGA